VIVHRNLVVTYEHVNLTDNINIRDLISIRDTFTSYYWQLDVNFTNSFLTFLQNKFTESQTPEFYIET